MNNLYKRKIKVASLTDSFFDLFQDGSDKEILQAKEFGHSRPCLILVKMKYKGSMYTFAIPFRSNISASAPKHTYHPLIKNSTTKDRNRHGLHYIKAVPVDEKKYLRKYIVGGTLKEELVLAQVEKELPTIIQEFKIYLENYEMALEKSIV